MIVPGPNPALGVTVHAIGGISASTCYVPFQKVKQWSWETYWLVFSLFAWLITPLVVGVLTMGEESHDAESDHARFGAGAVRPIGEIGVFDFLAEALRGDSF